MIDVCFSRVAEGLLKEFKKYINSNAVFHLTLSFDSVDK